jgi:hypothetical protein
VAAVHVGLVLVLAAALRSGLGIRPEVVGVLLMLPEVSRPARTSPRPPPVRGARPEPLPAPPPTAAAEAESVTSSIDWEKEAQRAAGMSVAPTPYIEFGKMPRGSVDLGGSGPRHRKGEQDRIGPGEWVLWLSDSCFTTSDYAVPLVTDLYPGVLKPTRLPVCTPEPRVPYVKYYWREEDGRP